MKFRRKPRETVDINLASLIDVVFILLLFFVVTTTFTRETQLRVDLPEAVSGSPNDEQNGKQLHGILVATLRGGLEKTAYTAEEAGFVITSIDAGSFALARLFSDTNQAQTEAVVNINGNCTDVIVLNNGKPAYMRVVPSGADDVSDAIANALSISFEDAERIKNQIGLQNVTGDERLEKAEEVIRETTAQLIVGWKMPWMAVVSVMA